MTFALDTETTLATDVEPVPRLVSVAIASDTASFIVLPHEPGCREAVSNAFARGVAMANAPFDVHVLLRQWPDLLPDVLDAYWNDRIYDVLTREKLIDIALGQHFKLGRYNLGAVALRRADIELNKEDPYRTRYAALLGLPIEAWPADAQRYAVDDAVATYEVWRAQEFERDGLFTLEEAGRQARKHIALSSHRLRGLHTDQGQVAAVAGRLEREIVEHREVCQQHELVRIGGTKKAPKFVRNTKVAKAMFEAIVGPNVPRTATGQVQLSKDALANADIPADHPLARYRQLGGTESLRTRLEAFQVPIVRGRYDELVASGRTSSSDPQLQNLPRTGGFRECLVAAPAPGHVFVISDWSGAELVTLAQVQLDLFGQSALADLLREGRDPHGEFGCRMFGITRDDPQFKTARQAAKAFNFGKPGGMGRARFIDYAKNTYGVLISEEEEAVYSAEYHRMFPEVRMLFDYVSALQDHEGLIDIVQPRSGRIRGRLRFPEACNTHFQGLASDAAGDCLWHLWISGLDSTSPLYSGLPVVRSDGTVSPTGGVLFVHDENVTQVRREVAESALAEQERIMIEAFGRWCPDIGIKVESHISERYGK